MWEQRLATSHRRITSVRGILAYVLAAFIAAFLWVAFSPAVSYAQEDTTPDVTWSNGNLVYQDNTYTGPVDVALKSTLGLPEDFTVYTYTDLPSTPDRKIHALYFAPGINVNAAEGANYRNYDANPPGTPPSNGSTAIPVSLESRLASADNDIGTSSCEVDGGMGWVICPITNTLATWMDWVFDILASFLKVRPLETTEQGAMRRAWEYMRTFANVAFVIAFLVIIYSQITSFGVSNYGIKKLLPRVIVAAILVNMSYVICALAIDLSNMLGYGIQNLFIDMRNTLVGMEGNTWDTPDWSDVAAYVLSGGAIIIGGSLAALGALDAYGTIGAAALAILLPALVILLLAVLIALAVMAARQALITVLTIIAPLAFVAYLLPNTEKWFDKWRSIFMTMLILFPAFSIIFGGSQFAASVIIQNSGGSIVVIILGMMVQVAPLFITPLLIKLSGSLLGRIAGMVNNPNKGIIDRTRNFAKDRASNMKARNLATPAKDWQWARRTAQRMDHSRRRREGRKSAYETRNDANWALSRDYKDLDFMNRESADIKSLGESASAKVYAKAKTTDVTIQKLDIDVRNAKASLENLDKDVELQYKNLQSQSSSINVIPAHLATRAMMARLENQRTRTTASAISAAEDVRNLEYAKEMETNAALRKAAGGIDPHGDSHAYAAAVQTIHKAFDNTVAAERATMSGLDGAKLAPIYRNKALSAERRAAALSKLIDIGGDNEIHDALDYLGTAKTNASPGEIEALSDMMKQVGADLGSRKPISLGAADVAALKRGEYSGDFDSKVIGRLTTAGGKLSVESLRTASADELKRILQHKSSVSGDLKDAIKTFMDPKKNPNFASQVPSAEIRDLMKEIADMPKGAS